ARLRDGSQEARSARGGVGDRRAIRPGSVGARGPGNRHEAMAQSVRFWSGSGLFSKPADL
uniref:hypothetical protein n=1 Tax=Serratia marcescens TaxID=615 RepID=UPI001953CE54